MSPLKQLFGNLNAPASAVAWTAAAAAAYCWYTRPTSAPVVSPSERDAFNESRKAATSHVADAPLRR
jgi:hypothetical protein